MRLKVIIPNSSQEFLLSQVKERKKAVPEGVKVDVCCLKHGPVSLESSLDAIRVAPEVLEEIRRAESEGYDAVTIDCAADPVYRCAMEVSNIPVVSAGHASYQYAIGLCRRFSIVTVLQSTANLITDNVSKYGLSHKVASVRAAGVPVLDLQDHTKTMDAIIAESIKAIELDQAEAIVLGCTGMSSLTGSLQARLGVPVVDPAVSALHMAISLVRMNLVQSRLCYACPPDKEIL